MSRTFSAAAAAQVAAKTAIPRRLFRLHLDGGTLRYSNHTDILVFAGETYYPRKISHSAIGEHMGSQADSTTISIDNADGQLTAYYAVEDFEGRDAEIWQIFLDAALQPIDSGDPKDKAVMFSGTMDMPADAKTLTITVRNTMDRPKSMSPHRFFQPRCNEDFCGSGCAYNGANPVEGTASSGSTTSLTSAALVGVASMVGARLVIIGGTNMALWRLVKTHDTGTGQVTFNAFPSAMDNTSEFIMDCDKLQSTCSGFDNLSHFDGYDEKVTDVNIPGSNAFAAPWVLGTATVKTTYTPIAQDSDPIPIAYGPGRITGKLVVAWQSRDTLTVGSTVYTYLHYNRIYAFLEGEIDSIQECLVNGVPIDRTNAAAYHERLGVAGQSLDADDFYPYQRSWKIGTQYWPKTVYVAIRSATIPPGAIGGVYEGAFSDVLTEDVAGDKVEIIYKGLKVQKYLADGTPDGAPAYNTNPPWCTLDYMMRRAEQPYVAADIDFSIWKTSADLADTLQYKMRLLLSEQKSDDEILTLMRNSCRAFFTYPSGKIALNIEHIWSGAAVHSFDDLTGGKTTGNIQPRSIKPYKRSKDKIFNKVIVTYRDEEDRENIAVLDADLDKNAATIGYKWRQGTFQTPGVGGAPNPSTMYIGGEAVTYTGAVHDADGTGSLTGCSARVNDYEYGYPIFQGPQTFPEHTAIAQDEPNQRAIKQVNVLNINGTCIGTYKQALAIATYHVQKNVYGNRYVKWIGFRDSLKCTVGDQVKLTSGNQGWVDWKFRLINTSTGNDNKIEYDGEIYLDAFYPELVGRPTPLRRPLIPNPYAALSSVTNLAVIESAGTYADGTYKPILTVTYLIPSDSTTSLHDKPHLYMATDPAGPWTSLGYDSSYGAGYSFFSGFKVGDTVYVKAVAVNKVHVEQSLDAAPMAGVTVLGKLLPPSDVAVFNVAPEGSGVLFSWNHIADPDRDGYEIRMGASFAVGTVVAKVGRTANEARWTPTTSGNLTFWIKAIDTSGVYSTNALSAVLLITPAAVSALSFEVIDNNVLLRWTGVQGTFPISSYGLRRGATYAGADVLGTFYGNFHAFPEVQSGQYKYWVTPKDTAGLDGSPVSITVNVSEPPDFKIYDRWVDVFTGTKTRIYYDTADKVFYAPANTTQTFDAYCVANGIVTMSDYVTVGGYTYMIEPSEADAVYEKTFDAGAVLPSATITADLDYSALIGTVDIYPTISTSPDNSTWTAYPGGWTAFGTNFRYVKIRIDFTAAASDVVAMTQLNVRLTVKTKYDQGFDTVAVAANGQVVRFNKDYVDVTSIGVTARSTVFRTEIYDFTDVYSTTVAACTTTLVKLSTGEGANYAVNDWIRVPLPDGTVEIRQISGIVGDDLTVGALSLAPDPGVACYPASFRVWLFDNTGAKATGDFSWDVAGI